jgi:putative transcriptional regulator
MTTHDITSLILELRRPLGLSQKRLAAQLGVSFRTVNRWENGHAVPSALALKQIKDLLHQMSCSSTASVRDHGKALLAKYF